MFRRTSLLPLLAAVMMTVGATVTLTGGAAGAQVTESAIEDYAHYVPQQRCRPKAKPGTKVLGRWIVRSQGGAFGGISRSCKHGGTSEHKEGRAFDWTLDATRKKDRQRAAAFLRLIRVTDKAGNPDARARRMGVTSTAVLSMLNGWSGPDASLGVGTRSWPACLPAPLPSCLRTSRAARASGTSSRRACGGR